MGHSLQRSKSPQASSSVADDAVRQALQILEESIDGVREDLAEVKSSLADDGGNDQRITRSINTMQRLQQQTRTLQAGIADIRARVNASDYLVCLNQSGEEIPAFAAMEVYFFNTTTNIAYVRKPTADSLEHYKVVFNGPSPVAEGKQCHGAIPGSMANVLATLAGGETVNLWDEFGTVSGSWKLSVDQTGFVCVGGQTLNGVDRPAVGVSSIVGTAIAYVGGKTVDDDKLLTAVSVQTLKGDTIAEQTIYCGNYVVPGYVFSTGSLLRVLKCSIVVGEDTISAWLPLDLWHVQGIAVLGGTTASSDTLTGIRVDLPDGTYLENQTVVVSGASGFKFPATYYAPVVYDVGAGQWAGSLSNIPPGTVEGQLLQWDNANKTWEVCPASVSENAILYRGSTSWEILAKPTYTSVLMSNGGAPYWQTLETFTCSSP